LSTTVENSLPSRETSIRWRNADGRGDPLQPAKQQRLPDPRREPGTQSGWNPQ